MSCHGKSSKLDRYVSKRVKKLKKEIPEEDFESMDVMGVGSSHGGDVGNEDFYATGDNRIPASLFGGVVSRNGNSKRKKKKSAL